MRHRTILFALAATTCFLAVNVSASSCPWFTSKNGTGVKLAFCAEPSPDNVPDDQYVAYEPDNYSVIPCKIGDEVTIRFIVGKNTEKDFYFGHMTRNVSKDIGTDVSKASKYFFEAQGGKNHWNNMFSYPSDEEGLRMASKEVANAGAGFDPSIENLVTVKLIVPKTGARNWDLTKYPMWITFCQYHKDSPLYYCLDATGNGSTGTQVAAVAKSKPFSIKLNATHASVHLENAVRSIISVHSIDGKQHRRIATSQHSVAVPLNTLSPGMYIISVMQGTAKLTQSLLVP